MAGKMKTVRLNVTVVTKDGEFKPGEPVKLPVDDADAYAALHGEVKAPAPEADPVLRKPTGEALTAAIKAAESELDTENEDHFTASGKPVVFALEKILGYDITAQERDAAWAELQAAASGS